MSLWAAGAARRPVLAIWLRNLMATDRAVVASISLAVACIATNSIAVKNRIFFMNVLPLFWIIPE
jgi:hypothetical protein